MCLTCKSFVNLETVYNNRFVSRDRIKTDVNKVVWEREREQEFRKRK